MHQLNLHNKVLSNNLCLDLHVSEDTVRRDLQDLALTGSLIKVHGGALSLSFNEVPFLSENIYSHENKRIIAEKAVKLMQNGMVVLTSGGTTIIEMARCLPPQLKVTFITGSIQVAKEYLMHPNSDVIIIGGKILKDSKITADSEAISRIRQINADLCFLGINAIDVSHGITENDWNVVQMKKEMIASSSKIVCMTIAEKLHTVQPFQVCELNKIHTLITELNPEDDQLKLYHDMGIQVL